MKYALSPNFEKLTSRTALQGQARYEIPYEGLLNPERTYFWRVRTRNEAGVWGAWSPVWSFTPQGPGVPLDVVLKVNREDRTAVLEWRPNPNGRPPVRYEIYGSDEKGFTASDAPYKVAVGGGKDKEAPANRIVSRSETALQVVGANLEWPNTNRAFYRVAAVDADGVRSGPSDYAEAPRPWIFSAPLLNGQKSERYRYAVGVVQSIGDLRTIQIDGNPYNLAFRDGDELAFELVDGPDWLAVDENGVIEGCPDVAGTFSLMVQVRREQGGEDVQQFVLDVSG